jgi:hypothetical protein
MFHLRTEYREYVLDCQQDNETAWPFRDWFETVYHYEMGDNLPTSSLNLFDGSFSSFNVCLN